MLNSKVIINFKSENAGGFWLSLTL